jgi:hypothetical protein
LRRPRRKHPTWASWAARDAGDPAPLKLFPGESLRGSLELGLSAMQGMVEWNPCADSA